MIGLDTSAIIDIFKGSENIKKFLESNREPLAATIISYLELYFGLDPINSKHSDEARYYDEFFEDVYNVYLTKDSCKEAQKIFWKLKKEGKIIEQFDCAIAALLITGGIKKILTKNPKHFERINQLSIIDY